MINETTKFFIMTLIVAVLFAFSPFTSYAFGASVSTSSATNITSLNATLNGYASTGGLPGNAWFEYGTDTNFGNSTSLNAYIFNAPYSGNFSTNISGLTANTTYYFRAVAQNSQGRVFGNVMPFTTNFSTLGYNNSLAQAAITTSGTVLADNTAQMNALILTGNSNATNTWFEWGNTPSLGYLTTVVPIGGAPAIRHTNTLTGLASGTAYYFRAVAQNVYGISYGSVLSFVTSGSPQVLVRYVTPPTLVTATAPATAPKITSTDTTSVDKNAGGISAASVLGANVFASGSFLPVNLFGWLILLILILVLVLLGKHAHGQFTGPKNK
jgi:hypothetical protein